MLPVIIIVIYACFLNLTNAKYVDNRALVVKLEESQMLGSSIVLNNDEIRTNEILMNYKAKEVDEGIKNPSLFLPSRHFFEAREDIHKSKIFKILQRMPKGGVLHGHDSALVSQEYLYNLTYRDNLYACERKNPDDRLRLKFLQDPKQDPSCTWISLTTLRETDPTFDAWLQSKLTLYVKNPKQEYRDINVVWSKFNEIFSTVSPLIRYRPVFEEYTYQALKELYEDNISYMEFRGSVQPLYELNGDQLDPVKVIKLYEQIVNKFRNDYPDFVGAKFIYAPSRRANNESAEENLETLKTLTNAVPDFLRGFDLVGQEDRGRPLSEMVDHLNKVPRNIDFYLHSGETNWYGTNTDMNLMDAILLGSKRIGHGFALVKHPELMKLVKKKNIGIEVCPISNQVLMLVADLRNHPANYLMASGLPIVISSDDPSFWATKGLSYDFYMAFMGIADLRADLKLLKQLAINSIQYTSLSITEKNSAMKLWERKWKIFIDSINLDHADNSVSSKIFNFNYMFFLMLLYYFLSY